MQQQQIYSTPIQSNITSQTITTTTQYNQPQTTTTTIQNTPVQFQEYQSTTPNNLVQTNPQIIQQQEINQIQQPIITKLGQGPNAPQIIQIPGGVIKQSQVIPLPQLPPTAYQPNSHFIRNFPIYESDPKYLSRFSNLNFYSQINTPVSQININKPTTQLQNVISTGPIVVNNTTPAINQVQPVVTTANNVVTGLNQIGPEVTTINSAVTGLNQVGTGLDNLTTGINNGTTTGLSNLNTGLYSIQKNISSIDNLTSGLATGANSNLNNLTTLQDKITSGINTGANNALYNTTPNLLTLQNQITSPNVLNTLENTITSSPNTGLNNLNNISNQVGEVATFLDNTRQNVNDVANAANNVKNIF